MCQVFNKFLKNAPFLFTRFCRNFYNVPLSRVFNYLVERCNETLVDDTMVSKCLLFPLFGDNMVQANVFSNERW